MLKYIKQVKEALFHGAKEIEILRRENETLAIKAKAFDAFAAMISLLQPRDYVGIAGNPDAVYIMRALLEKIEEAEKDDESRSEARSSETGSSTGS